MLDWILMAVLAHAFFSLATITDKIARTKYFRDSAGSALLVLLAQSSPVLLLPFTNISSLAPDEILLALFAGVMTFLPYWLYADCLKKEDVSRVAPLWQTIPLFVFVLAFIFLNEKLPPLFYPAFFLLAVGGLLISTKEFKNLLKPDRIFWLMLLASFLFSVQTVLLKFIYLKAGFLEVLALLCIGRLLVFPFIMLFPSKRERFLSDFLGADKRVLFAMFIFGALSVSLYNYAIYLGYVSIVEGLSGFYPFLVLAFAMAVSKWMPSMLYERIERKEILVKAFAATLMFIGLILLYL